MPKRDNESRRDHVDPWDKELQTFRHRDLQRAVVVRGMTFEEVQKATHQDMQRYFCDNYYVEQNKALLDVYDDATHAYFIAQGKDPKNPNDAFLFHPSLRLGFVGEKDEEGNIVKTKRVKGMKKEKKPKRKKNESFNIFAGTAKELTYKCQNDGLTMDQTIKKVLEKFPDKKEKSINIWYKRARKAKKDA